MNNTDTKKLIALVKAGKLSVNAIGYLEYINVTQGNEITYGTMADDLGKSINLIKKHIRRLETLGIILRKVTRRGVIFQVRLSKFWVPSGISYTNTSKFSYEEELREIISDLVIMSGTQFKVTETTKKLVLDRLNEGYTVKDFKQVHKNKKNWLADPKMHTYYRPSTLYAKKHFEDYLQEVRFVSSSKHTSTKWVGKDYQKDIKSTKARLSVLNISDDELEEDII